MFLSGTLNVFLVYLVVGMLLCIPPYTKWWKNLIIRLDSYQLNGRRLFAKIILIFPILQIISVFTVYIFTLRSDLYAPFLPTQTFFFALFCPASFVIIPLTTAFYGAAGALKKDGIKLGNFLLLLYFFGCFGAAASNIHDIIWCARATNLYRQFSAGGYDLAPWVEVLNAGTYDYRVFGFYMFIQFMIEFTLGLIIFKKYCDFNGVKEKFKPILLICFAMSFLAAAITVIDMPDVIAPPVAHIGVIMMAVIISSLIFYRSGVILNVKNPDFAT
ncbi:MAG: hypothetical protein AB1546_02585 [bacterium]